MINIDVNICFKDGRLAPSKYIEFMEDEYIKVISNTDDFIRMKANAKLSPLVIDYICQHFSLTISKISGQYIAPRNQITLDHDCRLF